MRNRFQRINCVFHLLGNILIILAILLLVPLVIVFLYWGKYGEGIGTVQAFLIPSFSTLAIGLSLRKIFRFEQVDMAASMLICAMGWLAASAMGALPFVIGIKSSYLNGFFETMSGFTTTGITVYVGLDNMPRSILFWRAFTQWVGGIGILSFFIAVTFRSGGAHHLFGAESHKISAGRPTPGLFNTVKLLWGIYTGLTIIGIVFLVAGGMSLFDSTCHCFTALSTGGFSPYDASISTYASAGYKHYRYLEYVLVVLMTLGGTSFLVHSRILRKDIKALWDNFEVRYWWGIIAGFVLLIFIDHMARTGGLMRFVGNPQAFEFAEIERSFRITVFQVVSILTTTGFATQDIGSSFFPVMSKQLFLLMMIIGGCVGSTGGGIKVFRVAILTQLMKRELRKLRVSRKASSPLVIDRDIIQDSEVHRVSALFFTWVALLVIGGAITAFFSNQGAFASFSGMCSALGNIGPCYIPVPDIIALPAVVKITYIFGMLAGRLEILPVLLIFSGRAWR